MEVKEWLEERAKGIGGSEAPAVLGLSKWKTPYQVWRDKRGLSGERERSQAMEWGILLEPIIRQKYSDMTGRIVRIPGHLKDDKYPFMLGTIDGITEDGRLVEIKTARSSQEWGEEGTDEIPQAYLIQVQHYLHITKLDIADIPVLFAGQDFRIYEVPADRELQDMIIEKEAEFWEKVEKDIPPDPITYADAVKRYQRSIAKTVTASPMVEVAVSTLKAIKEEYKIIEESEESAKLLIMKELAEADTLISESGDVLVTWKSTRDTSKFDLKAFQEKEPELYKQYLKVCEGSRRFLIKGQQKDKKGERR